MIRPASSASSCSSQPVVASPGNNRSKTSARSRVSGGAGNTLETNRDSSSLVNPAPCGKPVSANRSSASVSRTMERNVCARCLCASGWRSNSWSSSRSRVAGTSRRTHDSKSSAHARRSASDASGCACVNKASKAGLPRSAASRPLKYCQPIIGETQQPAAAGCLNGSCRSLDWVGRRDGKCGYKSRSGLEARQRVMPSFSKSHFRFSKRAAH